VDVEVCGEPPVGRTVCDFHHRGKGTPTAGMAVWADERKLVQILEIILGRAD
jgi:inosine-uridine nucleoside N-ribohydrolase